MRINQHTSQSDSDLFKRCNLILAMAKGSCKYPAYFNIMGNEVRLTKPMRKATPTNTAYILKWHNFLTSAMTKML